MALKFQRTRSHFLSDIFATVAVMVIWYLKLPKMPKGQVLFYACIWAVHLYAVVKGWVPKKFSLGWVSFYGKLVIGERILGFWFTVSLG